MLICSKFMYVHTCVHICKFSIWNKWINWKDSVFGPGKDLMTYVVKVSENFSCGNPNDWSLMIQENI